MAGQGNTSADREFREKASGVPVAWRGGVEVRVGEGLGVGRVKGGRLIEVELGLRGSTRGGEGRRPVGKGEMMGRGGRGVREARSV